MSKQLFLEQNLKEGEIYAGLVLGKNGESDHHVVVLAAKPDKYLNWKAAMAWAKSVGGDLPTRNEQFLLFANVSEQFNGTLYWSNTHHAHYAWMQGLGSGIQNDSHKSHEYSARAVRRIYIQE